jgi:hypothetical protein
MPSLVIMVLMDINKLEGLVDAWYANGSRGITILESSGARHLLRSGARDDLPMFPSLQSILAHQEVHHRTLLTILGDDVDIERFFDVTEAIVGDLRRPNNGIIMAMPITAVRGLREHDTGF